MTVVGVFGPWFYLAGFPTSYDTKTRKLPWFLRVLTMFIGTPIVAIYLLILYAYSAKILVTGVWPEGEVVWLMLAFLLIGFVVTLLSYPLQYIEKSPTYGRLQKGFFIATLPLMIVYFLAIKMRIEEYGWTDNRYIVVAFGIWIVINCCIYLFAKRDIRWIFGSFTIIALMSVLIPGVRMFDVGVASQRDRLMDFFEENGMIENGQIVASPELIQAEYSIQSILSYLQNRGALDSVLDDLADPVDTSDLEQWEVSDTVLRSLNIQTYSRYDEPMGESVSVLDIQQDTKQSYEISGYTQMLPFNSWNTQG